MALGQTLKKLIISFIYVWLPLVFLDKNNIVGKMNQSYRLIFMKILVFSDIPQQ